MKVIMDWKTILDGSIPTLTYRFSVICITNPVDHKMYMGVQGPRINRTTLKGKIKLSAHMSHFQILPQAHESRLQQWNKNRLLDKWTRFESSEINPHIYSQFIYDESAKNIQWDL